MLTKVKKKKEFVAATSFHHLLPLTAAFYLCQHLLPATRGCHHLLRVRKSLPWRGNSETRLNPCLVITGWPDPDIFSLPIHPVDSHDSTPKLSKTKSLTQNPLAKGPSSPVNHRTRKNVLSTDFSK